MHHSDVLWAVADLSLSIAGGAQAREEAEALQMEQAFALSLQTVAGRQQAHARNAAFLWQDQLQQVALVRTVLCRRILPICQQVLCVHHWWLCWGPAAWDPPCLATSPSACI